VPILIHEPSSIFSAKAHDPRLDRSHRRKTPKTMIREHLPSTSLNVNAKQNYQRFGEELQRDWSNPRVLVIGGRVPGEGMEALTLAAPSIELLETDVRFGPRTALLCDAHALPFKEGGFHGVIVQAVLEHVVDPDRCVQEIHRILAEGGLVYAETPFMQQVHEGRYDFTRFTHLGHRRLFRQFEEIDSGPACGPGTALAWCWRYFLLSFAESGSVRDVLDVLGRVTSFPFKYFDYYLIRRRGSFDAASSYYFVGRWSSRVLSDRELIKLYRGLG
jgi:SAM-dependent methyltransferase